MKRRAIAAQYCAHTHAGAPCVRTGTPHAICEVMGPMRPWPRRFVEEIVARGTSGDPAWQAVLVERMLATGEALWHAAARALGKPCACAACTDVAHPAHAWMVAS